MRVVLSGLIVGLVAVGAALVAGCQSVGPGGEPTTVGSEGGAEAVAGAAGAAHENAVLDLWAAGKTAFGVYVPDERPRAEGGRGRGGGPRPAPVYTREGGERLARNPLYDFVFLNLEGAYDAEAVRAIVEGLRAPGAAGRKTLLVRIPPISRDGQEAAAARVQEVLAAGADGVVLPHVRSPEEARAAIGFFEAAGADVWSPSNPSGEIIAMLMVEDPEAVERAAEFADLPGYSVLACGIGSLRAALDGDREAAEAGNQRVLAEAKRAGLADMITANAGDVEQRVGEGFLALLMQGPSADEVIALGRAAAGR
jgi:2-keto-3-deoxy-L-rhamnonate aldolase RhmA